jgi:phosphate transport system substrate-binding protein
MIKLVFALPALLTMVVAPTIAQQQPTPPLKGEGTGVGESAQGLDMQAARAKMMTSRGMKAAYSKKFDLSGLPVYQPRQKLSGTIRLWGSNYITDGRIGGLWEDAFRKYYPDIKFEWHMETTSAAVPSLVFGVSDIGMGRKVTFSELQMFERYTNRDPLEIEIATGSYNVPGWQPGYGVIVSKDNPLAHISMEQLDGIFGAERAGGWEGTTWHAEWARGPEKDIRTWGQLGLVGEWADKPINVYGLNLRYHQATEISDQVLKASDKWNEKLKIYANYVKADGTLARGMNEDLAADKYGIGIVAAPTTGLGGGMAQPASKILALGKTNDGPFVPYTLENIQNRTYPMFDRIYAYLDDDPKKGIDPKMLEFLRFIVSREGQELVEQDGKYLPLTAEVARAQLAKLDAALKPK